MKTEFKPPQWLQISIIILFIWNLVGIFAFVYDLIPDPSPLDEIRQNFRANFPLWIKIACGLAVGLGSLVTSRLFRRKSRSKGVLAISLLCVIIQMYQSMLIAGAI